MTMRVLRGEPPKHADLLPCSTSPLRDAIRSKRAGESAPVASEPPRAGDTTAPIGFVAGNAT